MRSIRLLSVAALAVAMTAASSAIAADTPSLASRATPECAHGTLLEEPGLAPALASAPTQSETQVVFVPSAQTLNLTLTASERDPSPGGAPRRGHLSYALADQWTADLGYRHALLPELGRSRELRSSHSVGFSSERDRDVLDLGLSWRRAESSVGIGYRLESSRVRTLGSDSAPSLLPERESAVHGLMLGVSREWGASR